MMLGSARLDLLFDSFISSDGSLVVVTEDAVMFMAYEVTPFAAPLSVGNKLLFARLLASLRLALVRHKGILAASDVSVNFN
jgi:hypothetical protein